MARMSLSFLVAAILIAACARDADVVAPRQDDGLAANLQQLDSHYFPIGTRSSNDTVLTAMPEPYSRKKHGPLTRVSDGLNLVGTPAFVPHPAGVKRGASARTIPPSWESTDGNRGMYLRNGRGVYATFDAELAVYVASGQLLYAPTAMPWGGSCVEATAVHRYGGEYTSDLFSLWDWCRDDPNWVVQMDMADPTFRNNYVRNIADRLGRVEQRFTIEVVAHDWEAPDGAYDCWDALLFNYLLGRWELVRTICGTIDDSMPRVNGWVMWESYHMMNPCSTRPSISAINIKVTWVNDLWITPNYAGTGPQQGACWAAGGSYSLFSIHDEVGLMWDALTPSYP